MFKPVAFGGCTVLIGAFSGASMKEESSKSKLLLFIDVLLIDTWLLIADCLMVSGTINWRILPQFIMQPCFLDYPPLTSINRAESQFWNKSVKSSTLDLFWSWSNCPSPSPDLRPKSIFRSYYDRFGKRSVSTKRRSRHSLVRLIVGTGKKSALIAQSGLVTGTGSYQPWPLNSGWCVIEEFWACSVREAEYDCFWKPLRHRNFN